MKALDWVETSEKTNSRFWLVWLPDHISMQEPSHAEVLHICYSCYSSSPHSGIRKKWRGKIEKEKHTYYLSKHLVTILSPLAGRLISHVKNTFVFAAFIACQSLHPGTVLVSFDVVSSFTKVPVDLAARVAHERLVADTSLTEHTSLSPDEVVDLLKICLEATYLTCKGEAYQQILIIEVQQWVHLFQSPKPTW